MKFKLGLALALVLQTFGGSAFAQTYPDKQITFVIPFPPGVTDLIARTIASIAERDLGQSIVVENKVGASGIIGVEAVRNSRPDGYTVLVASNQQFVALPQMRDAPYALEDFKVLRIASQSPVVFVARSELPFNDVKGLVEYAKQNPGKLRMATSGPQSAADIDSKLLARMAGLEFLTVPYAGVAPSVVAQLGGEVDLSIVAPNGARQHVAAGSLKWLGIQAKERAPFLQDVPTLEEQGYNILDDVKSVFLVPADTPDDVVKVLEAALGRAADSPEFKGLLKKSMIMPMNMDSKESEAFLKEEFAYWTKSLKLIEMLK